MRHFLTIFIVLFAATASAQVPSFGLDPGNVSATLVSDQDGIQAGKPFTVALKLEHAAGWHTYWLNPGVGQPTTIKWTLPEGFTAGELLWPIPLVKKTEIGMQHLMEGTTFLLTEITPPSMLADGTPIAISGKVSWLVCDVGSQCVPGGASVSLKLAASDAPVVKEAVRQKFDAVRADQPRTSSAWKMETTNEAQVFNITLTPKAGANSDPGEIYFFDRTKTIEGDPQIAEKKNGNYILSLKKHEDATAEPAGFVYAASGWEKDGKIKALTVGPANALPGPPPEGKDELASSVAADSVAATDWELPNSKVDYVEYHSDLTTDDLRVGGAEKKIRGFWTILFYMFLGGMILNLMPCVFPVLAIKILGFTRLAGHDRKKLISHAVAFAIGIVVFVLLLGAAIKLLQSSFGRELTWGFISQNPVGLAFIVILLFVLGLNLWGLFEIGTSLTTVGGNLQDKEGLAGSFWSGALTTVVATPCSGPFLGVAMAYTLGQPIFQQFVLLTVFGLGIAFPYCLLATSPKLVKKLPRPGAWMETFKKALAFPLFAFVIYFLGAYMAQTGSTGALYLLYGLLLVAIAAWIYGHWSTPVATARSRWTANLVALTLLIGGGYLGWSGAQQRAVEVEAGWAKWTPKREKEAHEAGRPVFVDYTTYGCLTCDINERNVFHSSGSEAVIAKIEETNTVMLQGKAAATFDADSLQDITIFRSLKRYDRVGFPTYVIIPRDKSLRPILLPEVIQQKMVIHALTLASH